VQKKKGRGGGRVCVCVYEREIERNRVRECKRTDNMLKDFSVPRKPGIRKSNRLQSSSALF